MRGVMTAPKKVMTGAFTLRFSFPMDVDLTVDDILVETIEGDTLGHSKDNFGGRGNHYHLLCYIPDARAGKSRFSVIKNGINVNPVIVEYNTLRNVYINWGPPIVRNAKLEFPVKLDFPVKRLQKRHFSVSEPMPCQLYGSGHRYFWVVAPKPSQTAFRVSVSGTVENMSGVTVDIHQSFLEGTFDGSNFVLANSDSDGE